MSLVRDKRVKDAYMVETIRKMFERGELRKDHPLQRKSESWTADYRDGFIATIIKQEDVDSIKVCEQLSEYGVTLWVIDGGHRLTSLTDYRNDAFKIGNKIDMPIIEYQILKRNKNGNFIEDKNGKRVYETIKFDLRGKRYSDLPEELKEKFDNDKIDIIKHLDCSDEEIAYHIRRYNKQKSMNVAQTSVTYMEKTAKYLKEISTNNRFFKDCGVYSPKERVNGSTDRIIMESVMCMFHFDEWKKGGKSIAMYLDEVATKEEFYTLDRYMTELTKAVDDDVSDLFNTRDSFIWFALYKKCVDVGKSSSDFVSFLKAFKANDNAQMKFSILNKGGTKDKKIINDKLELLDMLMMEYFHISIETKTENLNTLDFLRENVSVDIEEEDVSFYEDMFDDLILNVDNSSKLLEDENRNSLIGVIAYGCAEDIDIDDWFVQYFKNNPNYIKNQKRSYLHMKESLNAFIGNEVETAS